ncbi:MAG: nitroreductase family protein [Acidimicrobiales bacterium]
METWDALLARRQVRDYADTAVDEGLLRQVLEAGRRSPSSRNTQRWDFVVVTDDGVKADLARTWQGAHWTPGAPVVIALVAPVVDDDLQRLSIEYDLGQAATAMLVAAADLGLGSGQSSSRDQELARSILDLPPDRYCSKLLTIGHPADRPLAPIENPDRRSFDDVVHWGRW